MSSIVEVDDEALAPPLWARGALEVLLPLRRLQVRVLLAGQQYAPGRDAYLEAWAAADQTQWFF